MRGIRRWLTGTALLTGTAAWAQGPPVAEPPIAAALPGGTVVGSHAAPVAGVTLLPVADKSVPAAPAAGAPIVDPPPAEGKLAVGPMLVREARLVTPITTNAAGGCAGPGGDCCGPIGAHGPIGQEVYVRTGASFPIGNGLLVRGLNVGYATAAGGRAQFFSPAGDTAWTVDLHAFYAYNDAYGCPVHDGVGLGVGQDYFLAGPGFVGGLWDANLRYGWDVGGRWGAGHADLNSAFVRALYRRHYDVFGQPFVGIFSTLDIPMGGYTCLIGGRVEWNYTFSDIIPKQGSFQEVVAQLMFGVRY